jgi:hypothetical protein
MLEADQSTAAVWERSAVTGRFVRQQEGSDAPKRDRRGRLTKIDGRRLIGKRIDELKALFTSEFSADDLTPMRRMRIAEAAELRAMAEAERGAWMRGEAKCSLDELVRLERRADQAVRKLGLEERPERKLLAVEFLAERNAMRGKP